VFVPSLLNVFFVCIDLSPKTYSILVQNISKMTQTWDWGGVGIVFGSIVVLVADPIDAGDRF
jgi:hypothetical protein